PVQSRADRGRAMSQLILRPKPRQTLLRWLLLVSPIFFFGPILNLVRMCHVVAMDHSPASLFLRQLSVACSIVAVAIIYLATLIHVFYSRLLIRDGVLRLGSFARDKVPLSELVEVAGDGGDAENDFQEDLILRFKDGRQLTLAVGDYEEEDLRSFLNCMRQNNPACNYSYSDVIPLESRGLFRFLINAAEPDSLIVKLSKTPMQDMILQLIRAHEKNFWTLYALLWLVVVSLLSCYSMFLDNQFLQPFTGSTAWEGSAQLGELGELLRQAEASASVNVWTVSYLRLSIVARVAVDYFSHAGLDVLTVLWFLSGLIMAVIPVSRLVSPTFLFVDSRSLGIGVDFLRWENAKSVTLKRISATGDPLDGLLTVIGAGDQWLRIDLTRVPEGKKRQLILRLIDRYAGGA